MLLFLIGISFISVIVVLGLDLDLLLNGPDYIAKIVTNIINRVHEENIVNEELLKETLSNARQSLWVHIPMIVLAIISIMLILMNFVGCAGTVMMSYSLLSGFTMFMFICSVFYGCLVLWVFVNNMDDTVMDSFIADRIAEYHEQNHTFNLVIDTVQQDLSCCGFKSPEDWNKSFPVSCCKISCVDRQECPSAECVADLTFPDGCLDMIRSRLLHPTGTIGMIGVSFVVVVTIVVAITVLSFCLCLISRRRRSKTLFIDVKKSRGGSVNHSSMELINPISDDQYY